MSATIPAPSTTTAASRRARPRDLRRFWRVLLAVIAPLPGLAHAVAASFAPYQHGGPTREAVEAIAANPGALETGMWFDWVFGLTLVPAAIALAWVCRLRAPLLTVVGGVLTIGGFLAGMTLPDTEAPALVAAQQGLDPSVTVTLIDGMENAPMALIAGLLFLLGMSLGRIILGVAVWRTRVAPRWMAVALIAATPVHLLPIGGGNLPEILSWLLSAVGFTAATVALLRTPDDAFDLPPLAVQR